MIATVGLLLLTGCDLFGPSQSVTVQLPLAGATVRVENFGELNSNGRFELVVRNDRGEVRQMLWRDWGPAQRTNLYWAEGQRVIAIGGPGVIEMVDLPPGAPPRWIEPADHPQDDGAGWTYLGAVDRRNRNLVFLPASIERECIALFGVGSQNYRAAAQAQHHCP